MWDFLGDIGNWTGDLIGLDGSFGLDSTFGDNASYGDFSLGNIGTSTKNLFSSDASGSNSAINTSTDVSKNTSGGLMAGIGDFMSNDTTKAILPSAITAGAGLYGSMLSADVARDTLDANTELSNKYFDMALQDDEEADRKHASAQLNFAG